MTYYTHGRGTTKNIKPREKCYSCFGGYVIDPNREDVMRYVDAVCEARGAYDYGIADAKREYPEAFIRCSRCKGTRYLD